MNSGYSIDAIQALLRESSGTELPWEEVYRMVQRIKGSNSLPPTDGNQVVYHAADDGDDHDPPDFEVVDTRDNPELLAIEKSKQQLRGEVLRDLAGLLDDEGKVMIRLYYLESGEQRCTVGDIARYLGKTPKAAETSCAGFWVASVST